jgi:hypothetical protein
LSSNANVRILQRYLDGLLQEPEVLPAIDVVAEEPLGRDRVGYDVKGAVGQLRTLLSRHTSNRAALG